MKKEEFKNRLKELELEFDKKKKELFVQFALSHNTIKVGDIVKDHSGCAEVIKLSVCYDHNGYSMMRYNCIELTKNGKHKKKEPMRWLYQTNIKEVNGKPYNYDIE